MNETIRAKLNDITKGRTTDASEVRAVIREAREVIDQLNERREELDRDVFLAEEAWLGRTYERKVPSVTGEGVKAIRKLGHLATQS